MRAWFKSLAMVPLFGTLVVPLVSSGPGSATNWSTCTAASVRLAVGPECGANVGGACAHLLALKPQC